MNEKIKEVQDYFKAKILSGDFRVITIDDKAAEIIIDESYDFAIWVAAPEFCEPYSNTRKCFIVIPGFNEEEIAKCWSVFKPIIEDCRNQELRTEKLEQYRKLKAELTTEGII